jgi:hypothetical protein
MAAAAAGTTASLGCGDASAAQVSDARLAVGFNVTADSFYDGAGKHSNVLVEATMTGGPVTALGFPKAGSAVNYLIYFGNRYLWQQYKPGTYVIKGKGTGARVTATGSACSGGSVATFNGDARSHDDAGVSDGPRQQATPRSGRCDRLRSACRSARLASPDMTDLVVCHIDDEAHQAVGDAASFFTLEALADYTTQSKGPLRMMQWQQMTNSYMQDEADIPADKTIAILNAWGTVSSTNGARGAKSIHAMPSPEMMARLCVATGMPMWINVHPQMTDACMATFFRRIASIYTTGPIYVELGNEPWNSAYWRINSAISGCCTPPPVTPGRPPALSPRRLKPR